MEQKDFMPGAHYHLLTPVYETIVQPLLRGVWRDSAEAVVKRAPQNGKVVDIGCGPGTVLRMIREKRRDLVLDGIDIDPRMIEIAEERSKGMDIAFHVSSADKLPFPDQSTDIALSSMVFHHLPLEVKYAAFEEVKRILKSAGEFLLSDFTKNEKATGGFRRKIWKIHAAVLSLLEPEVKLQLHGQLFELARDHSATIETLSFPRVLVGLHSIRFPLQR